MVTKPGQTFSHINVGRLPNLRKSQHCYIRRARDRTSIYGTTDRTSIYGTTMDEEYILRWNDHGVSFFALAEDLLQQELLTDVTIWCGDRVFEAHRLVLCACSPLFKAVFPDVRFYVKFVEISDFDW